MNNNFDSLIDLLKTDERYVAEDGDLLKAKVYQDAMMMEESLLNLLLSQEETKEAFFTAVGDTLVFDKYEFAWLINSKEFLPDSYTAYTNKIGLATNRKFISQADDVVLDFPYKDAVLAGGQDKDDQKRDEIMFHSILAREQIMNMLTPKVFTNAKRYTAVGDKDLEGKLISGTIKIKEELATEFKEDDNLIIKGNNLIALSSLLERYEGKVKLIYIDPPYNTGSDSFGYNDRFNHSVWLTFMKNRLQVARRLLREDGILAIHIDDNEFSYITVLADEILKLENRIAIFPRITKKGGKSSDVVAKNHDYVLLYSYDESLKQMYSVRHDDADFKYKDEFYEDRGYYKLNQTLDYDSLRYSSNLDYPIVLNGQTYFPGGDKEKYNVRKSGKHKRADWAWRWSEELFEFGLENGFIVVKEGRERPRIYTKTYQKVKIDEQNNSYKIVDIERTKPLSTAEFMTNKYSNDNATKHAKTLGISDAFDYTKPETLLGKILEICTQENDLVLDFFMGSSTTQAVAMKMKRHFIGVEQMDYIHTVSVPRLHKVMKGEQGGISQDVDWQGGGSFVYCELKEDGQTLIDAIHATDDTTISEIKDRIYQDERIVPYLTTQELEKVDNEFKHLDINDKRKVLIELVDKNKLYVNYSSIDDKDYDVSDDDKSFTHSFYEVAK